MKRIIYLLILAIGITACVDLDLNPNDKPSSGTFWKSADDFDFALTV